MPTMRPVLLLLAAAIATVLCLAACSDDGTEPQPPTTVTFTLNERPFGGQAGNGGVVWLSDAAGAVLAAQEWSSDTTLVFDLGADAPATVTSTVAASNGDELVLNTEYSVPMGASRTYAIEASDEFTRAATLMIDNAPACDRVLISYQGASQGASSVDPDGHQIYFYTDIIDVFVRLDLTGGDPVGAWVRGVTDGQTVTLDYLQDGLFGDLVAYTVDLPDGGLWFSSFLRTTVDSGSREGVISFDMQDSSGGVPSELVMYAPAWAADQLELAIYLSVDGEPPLSYSMETDGVMPDAFVLMPGVATVTQPAPASMQFTMTGAWDSAFVFWRQTQGLLFGVWHMTVAPPQTEVALPVLPVAFQERFGEFTREGFELGRVELERDEGEGVVLRVAWYE